MQLPASSRIVYDPCPRSVSARASSRSTTRLMRLTKRCCGRFCKRGVAMVVTSVAQAHCEGQHDGAIAPFEMGPRRQQRQQGRVWCRRTLLPNQVPHRYPEKFRELHNKP